MIGTYFAILTALLFATFFIKLRLLYSSIVFQRSYGRNLVSVALIALVLCSLPGQFTWMDICVEQLFRWTSGTRFYVGTLTWPCLFFYFQALCYIFESTCTQNSKPRTLYWFWLLVNIGLAAVFLYWTATHTSIQLSYFVGRTIKNVYISYMFLVIFWVKAKLWRVSNPEIVNRQTSILTLNMFIFVFFFLFDFICSHNGVLWKFFGIYRYEMAILRSIPTIVIVYSTLHILMRYRFLNINKTVTTTKTVPALTTFLNAFEELINQHCTSSLNKLVKEYFNKAYNLDVSRVDLYIRPINEDVEPHAHTEQYEPHHKATVTAVDEFIEHGANSVAMMDLILQADVLDRDELSCDAFYAPSPESEALVKFMDVINAKIFLPIVRDSQLYGYIVVANDAQNQVLFTNVHREEMRQYAAGVGVVINKIYSQNVGHLNKKITSQEQVIHNEHRLNEQLFEAVSVLYQSQDIRTMGLIYYENENFVYGNPQARDLIGISFAEMPDHQIIGALKNVVRQVVTYHGTAYREAFNDRGEKIVLLALKHYVLDQIIILVSTSQEHVSVQEMQRQLQNKNDWFYALSLGTTKQGQLISRLFPGNTALLTNFKVMLLKASLTKKPAFVCAPEVDIQTIVDMLHTTSVRNGIETITLEQGYDKRELAMSLVGRNQLAGNAAEEPLLKRMDKGTVCIRNVHLLDKDNQRRIAEYLTTGNYRPLHSTHTYRVDVRLIVTSPHKLDQLLYDKVLIPEFGQLLEHNAITLASPQTLSEREQRHLVESVDTGQVAGLVEEVQLLGEDEKRSVLLSMPISMTELTKRIATLKTERPSGSAVDDLFAGGIEAEDALVKKAYLLKRKALDDAQIMAALWRVFKKNKSRIANLLGVSRGAIDRRCKAYGLSK